jgi:hypothetical protein
MHYFKIENYMFEKKFLYSEKNYDFKQKRFAINL